MNKTMKKGWMRLFFMIPAIVSSQEMMDLQECLRRGLEKNYA